MYIENIPRQRNGNMEQEENVETWEKIEKKIQTIKQKEALSICQTTVEKGITKLKDRTQKLPTIMVKFA